MLDACSNSQVCWAALGIKFECNPSNLEINEFKKFLRMLQLLHSLQCFSFSDFFRVVQLAVLSHIPPTLLTPSLSVSADMFKTH